VKQRDTHFGGQIVDLHDLKPEKKAKLLYNELAFSSVDVIE